MSDVKTTITELRKLVKDFRDARDWKQFHDPKNLAEALVIEAGELLEHFLWKDKSEVARKLKNDNAYREEVSDELADVFGYVINIAISADIDLSDALRVKYLKNGKKYPVKKAKGNRTKYTEL